MSSSDVSTGGVGFSGMLTIVFIILKLWPAPGGQGHIINWSWWWVLSPIWISWLVIIAVLLLVGIGYVIYHAKHPH